MTSTMPPPPAPEEEREEATLECVTLGDDNQTLLINGLSKWALKVPDSIRKRSATVRKQKIKNLLIDLCDSCDIDWRTEENLNNITNEAVSLLYDHKDEVLEKPITEVTQHNSGKWRIPKIKIVGVSPPYKLISQITLKCNTCNAEIIEDYSEMPLMSYKQTERRCNVCVSGGATGRDIGSLTATPDHVEAVSVSVQDSEMSGDDQKRLHVILMEEQTKNVRVGEVVTITGDMTVLNPLGIGNKKATAAMYARNIKYERENESPITDDDIAVFQDFAKKHGAQTPYELAKMFAPGVIGHMDAKIGILRSIVSVKECKHITGFRTRVHTDLAGDPGTVKSTLAYESTEITPNAEWVTAEHAAIKSTLAIVDKDHDSGGTMLMLGPIPRAKNSLCAIDEIGSQSYEDQQHYASIMEQGRFTKIAHGRDYEIDSPTTFIVTTNPTGGYWDKTRKPSLDQIPIKSNIKDRLDQHYLFQDFETDEECVEFAMQKALNYLNPESVKPDYDLLKRYLAYAASRPVPRLTSESASMLSFIWQKMRKQGFMSNRSLDTLYRIALAQARLHLKDEVDTQVVKEVMQDMQIMYSKLGKLVDPAIEDPRTLAREEIIKYVNTIAFPIGFTEALRYVYEHNELVKQYLGSKVEWWNARDNKKIRAIYDMFTDGGTGEPKRASDGSTVAIHDLKPLTLVRVVVEANDRSHRSQRSPDEGKKEEERSNEEKNPSTSDLSDPSDLHPDIPLNDLVKKSMKDDQDNKIDYFTLERWRTKLMLLPVQHPYHSDVDQADQILQALIEEGKVREIEPGKYAPTESLKLSGGD